MVTFGKTYDGVWGDIAEFDTYAVCQDGRVVNKRTGEQKRTSFNQQGIRIITLVRDGARITKSVALLVAQTFLTREGVPEAFDTPTHKDGDKTNCHVSNLEWRPRWFAVKYHKQFLPENVLLRNLLAVPIILNETEEVFENSFDCAVKYCMLNMGIVESLQNETRSFPHGYTFSVWRGDSMT